MALRYTIFFQEHYSDLIKSGIEDALFEFEFESCNSTPVSAKLEKLDKVQMDDISSVSPVQKQEMSVHSEKIANPFE